MTVGLGGASLVAAYAGAVDLSRIMLGSTEVWSSGPPSPFPIVQDWNNLTELPPGWVLGRSPINETPEMAPFLVFDVDGTTGAFQSGAQMPVELSYAFPRTNFSSLTFIAHFKGAGSATNSKAVDIWLWDLDGPNRAAPYVEFSTSQIGANPRSGSILARISDIDDNTIDDALYTEYGVVWPPGDGDAWMATVMTPGGIATFMSDSTGVIQTVPEDSRSGTVGVVGYHDYMDLVFDPHDYPDATAKVRHTYLSDEALTIEQIKAVWTTMGWTLPPPPLFGIVQDWRGLSALPEGWGGGAFGEEVIFFQDGIGKDNPATYSQPSVVFNFQEVTADYLSIITHIEGGQITVLFSNAASSNEGQIQLTSTPAPSVTLGSVSGGFVNLGSTLWESWQDKWIALVRTPEGTTLYSSTLQTGVTHVTAGEPGATVQLSSLRIIAVTLSYTGWDDGTFHDVPTRLKHSYFDTIGLSQVQVQDVWATMGWVAAPLFFPIVQDWNNLTALPAGWSVTQGGSILFAADGISSPYVELKQAFDAQTVSAGLVVLIVHFKATAQYQYGLYSVGNEPWAGSAATWWIQGYPWETAAGEMVLQIASSYGRKDLQGDYLGNIGHDVWIASCLVGTELTMYSSDSSGSVRVKAVTETPGLVDQPVTGQKISLAGVKIRHTYATTGTMTQAQVQDVWATMGWVAAP